MTLCGAVTHTHAVAYPLVPSTWSRWNPISTSMIYTPLFPLPSSTSLSPLDPGPFALAAIENTRHLVKSEFQKSGNDSSFVPRTVWNKT